MGDQATIFESFLEASIKLSLFFALALSRVLIVQTSLDYYTTSGWRRLFWPCIIFLTPSFVIKNLVSPEYHIVNHEFFRMLPEEQAKYVEFDQKLNMYKDVEDIKYNFKYRSTRDYYKTRRYIH